MKQDSSFLHLHGPILFQSLLIKSISFSTLADVHIRLLHDSKFVAGGTVSVNNCLSVEAQ